MKIEVIPAQELSAEYQALWAEIQAANRDLDSPYFHPEFTRVVAQVGRAVEVAVLSEAGRVVGFLPFERRKGNLGRPVAGPLSDFHGVVMRPGHAVDARRLVAACGLSAWFFRRLIAGQAAFESYRWALRGSPYIDTSRGFDAYCEQRRRSGGKTVGKTFRKLRKLERDLGPVRFEALTADREVLRSLITWKAEQCRRTGLFDYVSVPWTGQLLEALLCRRDDALRGMMAALYIGDELHAALYGMRSNRVLHLWITTYCRTWAQYSPGYQLLIKLIEAAPQLGIDRIDLGAGEDPFKQHFMSGTIPVAEGSVDLRTGAHQWRRLLHRVRRLVRESPLRKPVARPWRLVKRLHDEAEFA
jgi:CelD/BcsL family acetyltransferase involved in cellulose biosynthesis